MTKFYLTRLVLLLAVTSALSSAYAAVGDKDVLLAREAYDKNNAIALSQHVQQLERQQHILAPYANYWLMLLNLSDASHQDVTNFLDQYSEYPFADRLRGEYLKKLGRQKDWDTFSSEYYNYQAKNAAVECYAAEALAYHADPSVLASSTALWMRTKKQPNSCGRLFNSMQAAGVLSQEDIWQRFRIASTANRVSLAKAIVRRTSGSKSSYAAIIGRASKSPTSIINQKLVSLSTRFGREVSLFALDRLARKNTKGALAAYQKIQGHFTAEEKSYFYGRLALRAAKRHESKVMAYFEKAEKTKLNKEQVAWHARAALRQENWSALLDIIAAMEPAHADEARWRYWKARALNTQQQDATEVHDILTRLAIERHYYGWLAQGELENYIPEPLLHYKATDEEVNKVAALAGIQRVGALKTADFRWAAKSEWASAIKGFDDKQLLAAAEFAMRQQWHDLAIVTADKTTEFHDFALRYPLPYRDLMRPAASAQNIDETWVYGITRQESRFMHYAKSRVGASGLMQLMPATAKWAARQAGIRNYKRTMIHELDTNITLGTFYLGHTLDIMGGQKVMATAGYNAGPGRAKQWRGYTPLEGTIYAETIPFNETRVYVQRVMANAHLYAQQLELKTMTLKQRMGTIPAKPAR